jgi:hypothetical protein
LPLKSPSAQLAAVAVRPINRHLLGCSTPKQNVRANPAALRSAADETSSGSRNPAAAQEFSRKLSSKNPDRRDTLNLVVSPDTTTMKRTAVLLLACTFG